MNWYPKVMNHGRPAPQRTAFADAQGFQILLLYVILLAAFARFSAHAQGLGATMTTSLIATQGETLTYTVIITNRGATSLSNVLFTDVLDPHTAFINGSLNTSPLAFPDTYAVLGNVPITIAAPGVLANDLDPDGVGPALIVVATNATSASGGSVSLTANGGFTYNPPPGFEGTDTFTYLLNDGENFTDTGTVSLTVSGMIWFVNGTAPAGGKGRLTDPFNTLGALAAINNGLGTNPAAGDNVFLYSGNYAGPLTLLNNQKLIGQGATAALATIAGVTPPPGSLALPGTGGARPTIAGSSGGITLAAGNLLRGLNLNNNGGTSLSGTSVGALVITEAAVTNTAGVAINLANGALNVTLGSVAAAGGVNGIRLANCTGSFAVIGDGASAQNGTGGTIQNTSGNGVHLDNAANVSLARMNINSSAANGVFGQNVNGFVIDWCSLNSNGDAVDEAGIRLGDPVTAVNGLVGSAPGGANPTRIANTLIRASGEMNVAIFNNGGTLTRLDVTNVVSKDTRTRPLGADGFLFEVRGSGQATVNFTNCAFSDNVTQGIQASALAQSALSVTVGNCGFTNNNEGVVLANANDASLTYDLNGNRFFNSLATGASGSAIAAINATTVTSGAIYSGKIRNNIISGGGIDNHLVTVLLAGAGQNTIHVANNTINAAGAQFSGIFLQAGETGSGSLNANATVTGNNVNVGALGSHGIAVQSRITSTLCAEIAGNVSTTGGVGLFGINVRQRDASTFRLPNFAGPFNSTAAVIAFLQGKNPGTTVNAAVATSYTGGAACVLPLLAMPRSADSQFAVVQTSSGLSSDDSGHWLDEKPRATEHQRSGQSENCATAGDASSHSRLIVTGAGTSGGKEGDSLLCPTALLTPDSLAPIITAARQRWIDTGLTREQTVVLDSLRFEVADLAGWHLGASSNRVVLLDRRASGHGWFIDPAPNDNPEFSSTTAHNRIDLLSAVLHEMGHNLGLADDYSPAARGNVMYGILAPGERRLPSPGQVLHASADLGTGVHYVFTPLNLGTLPAGKSLTITFRVTVANVVPPGTCALSNQGTVTANGGVNVLTDDPRTPTPLDATITALRLKPVPVTLAATAVTATSAILNGSAIPGGEGCGYMFTLRESPNTQPLSGAVAAGGLLSAGCAPVALSGTVIGLKPNTSYNFTLVASNSLGFAFGSAIEFTTLPPSILQQPEDVLSCSGNSATFNVVMESGALGQFQWQRLDAGASSFQDISGATNATYTTPPVTAADHGARFRVVFTGGGVTLTSASALLSVGTLSNPNVLYDFNNGLPPNTAIYGDTFMDTVNGTLELTPNVGGQNGAFLTADLAPGRAVNAFTAAFRVRLTPGTYPPADGFSFNWATDLPFGIYGIGEEGQGNGLTVSFDTFDNGLGEAPAIDVRWNSNLIAHTVVPIGLLATDPAFAEVQIRLRADATLDVTYGCQPVYTRLPIPNFTPLSGARFGLGARTGGLWETHTVDDFALQVSVDPTNGLPRITTVAPQPPAEVVIRGIGVPGANVALQFSTNLLDWAWRAFVTPDAGGVFQFTDSTSLMSQMFYRVVAVPQMPAGLVTWWRAEGNFLDSFGPNNGSAFGVAPDFAAGQLGRALSFNGTNQAMWIGGADIAPPWTAALWVKRQDASNASAALLTSPLYGLKLEQWPGSRQIGFTAFGVADYTYSYIAPADIWTHLTFVGTPAGTTLYVNGIAQETIAAPINLPVNLLGSRENGTDPLQGQLDEVTLFNRALTPDEIQGVFNASRGP